MLSQKISTLVLSTIQPSLKESDLLDRSVKWIKEDDMMKTQSMDHSLLEHIKLVGKWDFIDLGLNFFPCVFSR